MNEPIECLVSEIKSELSEMENSKKRITDLLSSLEKSVTGNYDWVSVKKAGAILDVSLPLIYRKIAKGVLNVKYIGAKQFVRLSELEQINDKEVN